MNPSDISRKTEPLLTVLGPREQLLVSLSPRHKVHNVGEVNFDGSKNVYPCVCSYTVCQGRENRRKSPLSRGGTGS